MLGGRGGLTGTSLRSEWAGRWTFYTGCSCKLESREESGEKRKAPSSECWRVLALRGWRAREEPALSLLKKRKVAKNGWRTQWHRGQEQTAFHLAENDQLFWMLLTASIRQHRGQDSWHRVADLARCNLLQFSELWGQSLVGVGSGVRKAEVTCRPRIWGGLAGQGSGEKKLSWRIWDTGSRGF